MQMFNFDIRSVSEFIFNVLSKSGGVTFASQVFGFYLFTKTDFLLRKRPFFRLNVSIDGNCKNTWQFSKVIPLYGQYQSLSYLILTWIDFKA